MDAASPRLWLGQLVLLTIYGLACLFVLYIFQFQMKKCLPSNLKIISNLGPLCIVVVSVIIVMVETSDDLAKFEKSCMIMEEIRRREKAVKAAEDAKKAEAIKAAKAAALALQEIVDKDDKVPDMAPSSDNEDPNIAPSSPALGKRACPSLASGEEWAASITTLSPEYLPLFTRIQEFITDNITFSPEFFGYITDEYNRMSSNLSIGRRVKNNKRIKTLLGKGPGGVYPPEDVVGGAVDIEQGILDLFHQISYAYNKTSGAGGDGFILPREREIEEETVESDVEKIESVAPTTSSSELIVSETYDEPYDGAL